jgi:cytochrome c oxidase subunit IV
MADAKQFSPDKIFLWLFLFTGLEVLFGMAFHGMNRLFLWSGLGFFAFLKGWLIMVYFMHLKFEGWVVKSLIVPTIFLMMVIWGYVSPDITNSQYIDHPIGSMYDNASGAVISDLSHWDPVHGEGGEHGKEDGEAAEH